MAERVVYQNGTGGIEILIPVNTAMPIDRLARMLVPAGQPFAIVDESEIPTDRTLRDEWTVDPAELVDGIGERVTGGEG